MGKNENIMSDLNSRQDVALFDDDGNALRLFSPASGDKQLYSVGDTLFQRLCEDGKGFRTSTNGITIAGATETGFVLLRNPSGSGVTVRFNKIFLGLGLLAISSNRGMFRFYRAPTITTNGTALTVSKIKTSQSQATAINAYSAPIVTSFGTLVAAFNLKGENGQFVRHGDLTIFLEAGSDKLITFQGNVGGLDAIFGADWVET